MCPGWDWEVFNLPTKHIHLMNIYISIPTIHTTTGDELKLSSSRTKYAMEVYIGREGYAETYLILFTFLLIYVKLSIFLLTV